MRFRAIPFWPTALFMSLLLALACSERPNPAPAQAAATPPRVEYYPRARWRLGDPAQLDKVIIWASHIQIRHAEVQSPLVAFTLTRWHAAAPASRRSKADAHALAQFIALEAQRAPARFADLARRYSEDEATSRLGGTLGGLTATHFAFPPEVLDAFVETPSGGVSRVVETDEGYHVLLRHAPPPEETVSGRRIVIRYAGADGLLPLGVPPTQRTRAQASELAQSLHAQLLRAPERFAEMVRSHSEHPDAARDGDMGSWSTWEPTHQAREVALLQGLKVGELGAPLDTAYGFQILLRTAPPPRPEYAMEAIRLGFDAELADEIEGSKASALQHARQLIEVIRADPSQFSNFQSRYCCRGVQVLLDGRDELGRLTAALSASAVGELGPEPIDDIGSYVIAKRVSPPPRAQRPLATFDIPSPEHIDLPSLLRSSAGDTALGSVHVSAIEQELRATQGLSPIEAAAMREFAAVLDASTDPDERVELYQRFQESMKTLLGGGRYEPYLEAFYAYFERIYLRPHAEEPAQTAG